MIGRRGWGFEPIDFFSKSHAIRLEALICTRTVTSHPSAASVGAHGDSVFVRMV